MDAPKPKRAREEEAFISKTGMVPVSFESTSFIASKSPSPREEKGIVAISVKLPTPISREGRTRLNLSLERDAGLV